ncbi:GNAT family N-acetyltransferase [Salinivibrio kushneri]|uniref:GNAT family N-acetyltransferase n=1 Tax=Salinivibrio kushneri TaxID=1908198 RepID=UPI0022B4539C|nr:GNAT family N-acetyltransferase [Salinivibrio kushneri]WBA18922.1 GNAT family N-acetyltransferase [Salinivibrio kushneri]
MHLTFRPINLETDFAYCVAARRDAFVCSFGSDEGFEDFLTGYYERVSERMNQPEWFYRHIFVDGEWAGQLEFRSTSSEPETGYVHLIYLAPAFRGRGFAPLLQRYIKTTLTNAGCRRALLSVSRDNHRALAFYRQHGWEFVRANPKHAKTDFYQCWLPA